MSYLGSDSCVELEDVTVEAMKNLVDRAMSEEAQHDNVAHLQALAQENGHLAAELLRS